MNSFFFIKMEENFSIGMGCEIVPLEKFSFYFNVIIYLPIKYKSNGSIFILERLTTGGGKINN